jgi:ParB/RepB/Spo0J family partition protein
MEASEQFKQVELSLIKVSGANPRKNIKGESFKEIKQSIAELGILEPLIVRPKGKGYELVAGERRLTAAKELKLETVPVMIRDLDDHTARVVMLLENLQREDLQPLEEAAAIEELLKDTGDGGMTQDELAKKLSKSQPWVANRLRLNKAPPEVKKYLEQGKISAQHVITLLPFTEWPIWEKVLKQELANEMATDFTDDPFTVERCRDMIEQILERDDKGENCFKGDRLPWKLEKYRSYLDLEACKTCKVPISFKEFNGAEKDRRRVCLKIDCFRPKFKAAAKAYKEAEAKKLEKLEKTSAVAMNQLSRENYEILDYCGFPKDDCKDCPHKKLSKEAISSIDEGSNKKRTLCLDRTCFHDKRREWSELMDGYGEKVQDAVLKASKQYLASRSAGLKKPELMLLAERWVQDYERLKKGKLDKFSEKDLEAELLNSVIIDLCEYGSVDDLIRTAQGLPFKVELPEMPDLEPKEKIEIKEDMDPALKEALEETGKGAKKKTQEKRKKKGV